MPALKINISYEHLTLLQRKRAEAMREGVLVSKAKDYVPATIQFQGREIPGQVRLKGDWLDHLKGRKWSLRVKLGEDAALMGMQQFSLQNPRTRSYLDEWIFHRILEQEDLLTPRYTFVQVWWNDSYKGIFALEEHFEQALLERHHRRKGPILRYSEDGFWQCQAHRLRHGKNLVPYLPDFEAADIEAFQRKRVLRDSNLHYAFQAGRQRLEQYRQGLGPASQLLDVEQMARFYALADVASAYHALRWHNLRFYYNPITTLLEPVIFDAYGSEGPYRWFSKPYLGFHSERYSKVYFAEEFIVFSLFNEPEFRERYRAYLRQYTDPGYWSHFWEHISGDLDRMEEALQRENNQYSYDRNFLKEGAERMREHLQAYDSDHPPFRYEIYDPLYEKCATRSPLPAISLKAEQTLHSNNLQLRNFYCQPVQIQATGPKRSKPLHQLDRPLELPAFDIHSQPVASYPLSLPKDDRFVFFSVPGIDYWYKQKVSSWPVLDAMTFPTDTFGAMNPGLFKWKGDTLWLRPGRHRIEQNLEIPAGIPLVVPPGVQLDFVNRAAAFIQGSLSMRGTERQPIIITSSDKSGGGWHLLRCPGTVQLRHVQFTHLGEWKGEGRLLSGGLSLYETDAEIEHCLFKDCRGEDALNVVRSKVKLEHLQFERCAGDALDIDFSEVRMVAVRFQQIGGDAIDLSGSKASVKSVQAAVVADKGLSVGEGSEVELEELACWETKIGLAVKDSSVVNGRELTFTNCTYGIAVFSKKNIYGTASFQGTGIQIDSNVVVPFILENPHRLLMDGESIAPTYEAGEVVPLLYPPED